MSLRRSSLWPGTGRVTLLLLAAVPAAMAYPWQSMRDRWVLGIGAAVAILLLGRWRGLYATTILRRRMAMSSRNSGLRRARDPGIDVRATALLHVRPSAETVDVLPLPLITRYLDRYGIRADAVRITSRDTGSDTGVLQRDTWIGMTVSAVANLAALQARSPQIPLLKTTEVAVRRLADHLRELGWSASTVGAQDIPPLFNRSARETWRGVRDQRTEYVAAYQVNVDSALPDMLAAIRSHVARETWTSLEISGTEERTTVAVACAFRTEGRPSGSAPLPGLTPQNGNHWPALTALDPLSTRRLDGHTELPASLLERLRWPSVAGPAPSRPRHAAAV
ncbi:type VII secretion protein EccE [Mycobacterium heckeshornense]|uniref:Type VII secretion protein EccE n=1 Tax=Mycobacterium heckeshornense TaxID=110505 RepID=A0A2G8BBV8_9MYCO|nr:type VII secretion protein EccE [Mycobacterium heckeshornense]MCV7035953.1 type VII secretion protein EccE [Mycobacterium heckeshornense]PIJ35243.1 type VII secretion protein EccE [Mycobacterium heckeshornense]BCO38103.1 type VII secretion protein EccE [Mycobacterium heckeshornense]BCQ10958.1 type VII secretion protein EccE [Mycobacterium heckeshornense]